MRGLVTNGIQSSHSNLAPRGKGAGAAPGGYGALGSRRLGLPAVQVRPSRVAPACALAAARTRAGLVLALGLSLGLSHFRSGGKPQRGPRSPPPWLRFQLSPAQAATGCGSGQAPRVPAPRGVRPPERSTLCPVGLGVAGSADVRRPSRARGAGVAGGSRALGPLEPTAWRGPHFRRAPHPGGPETGSALGVTSRPSGPGPLPEPASLGTLGPLSCVQVLQRRALSSPH